VTLARREDQAFREHGRRLPAHHAPDQPPAPPARVPPAGPPRPPRRHREAGPAGRRRHRPRMALAQPSPAPSRRYADPQALLDAEWQAVEAVGVLLRQSGHAALAHFLALHAATARCPCSSSPSATSSAASWRVTPSCQPPCRSPRWSVSPRRRRPATTPSSSDALAKHSARAARNCSKAALTLLSETHGDVKDIKATPGKARRQHLEGRRPGGLPARCPASPSPPRPRGSPRARRRTSAWMVLNTLLTTPHRRLDLVHPGHQELVAKDPRFYVHLAAWYFEKGEVRDHKEMFIVTLAAVGLLRPPRRRAGAAGESLPPIPGGPRRRFHPRPQGHAPPGRPRGARRARAPEARPGPAQEGGARREGPPRASGRSLATSGCSGNVPRGRLKTEVAAPTSPSARRTPSGSTARPWWPARPG